MTKLKWLFSKSPTAIKIAVITLAAVAFFYLGKHWYDGDATGSPTRPLYFPSSTSRPTVSISPNSNNDVGFQTGNVERFGVCPESMKEYVPCMDNLEAIRKLKSHSRGEKFERHCPDDGKGLDCLVPAPKDYKIPIPWPQSRDQVMFSSAEDGILLLELNRMLRAGGYFAWAAQPVYKHEEAQQEAWIEMENLTSRMCWELVKKEGYIAIWRKPLDNNCYFSRDAGVKPPVCDEDDDPDRVWYTDMKPCISRIPENGYGANITAWPARLYNPPDRLQAVNMDAYMAKRELFKAESRYWDEIIKSYVRSNHWKEINLRNVMDMRAGFGGFAAALINQNIDCWVMNIVPITEPNTLPVIYDRGLIGAAHDWCEPFDTYPRTYDLLHAAFLFSKENKLCNITSILLEMDRMLRPGGRAYIRDSLTILDKIKGITDAMGWRGQLKDTSDGSYANTKVLMCEKQLLQY